MHNDRIRLLEYTGRPGDVTVMRHHPDVLAYPLRSGSFKFALRSGDSFEVDLAAGEPMFVEAQDHSTENTGSGDARVLLIELK